MTSHRLDSFARAAMLGLLAAAAPACGDDRSRGADAVDEDSSGGSVGAGGLQASGGAAAGGSSSGGSTSGGANTGGGASHSGGASGLAGEGGMGEGGADAEGVISSETIVDLSLEDFTALCDEAGGVVETHAHCGGVVTGPGFSYDLTIDVFTEHTCAGYNTCTGFSCVIDE